MPLPLRVVEPVHVSRGTLPDRIRVRNELEAVANGTLANVIRQLSRLSHHAEEIFSDLIRVGSDTANRANNLLSRIDRLAVKVVQMDGLQEECTSMHDSLNTKPFQSSMMFDQQVVSRSSLPPGMSKIYQLCDRPPPLDKLNRYRDDGKDGLKFYTDANYFFELWRQDMLKDTERAMFDKVKKPHKPKNEHGARHKKRVRQPNSTRDRQRHVAIEHGEHIMMPGVNTAMRDSPDGMYSPEMIQHQRQNARPNSIEFKYQNDQMYNNEVNSDYRQQQQMQQNHYEAYSNQPSHLNNHQRYYPVNVNSPPPPYESPAAYARASTPRSNSVNQTPSSSNGFAFRPSQPPPPAPPPAYAGTPPSSHSGTPTRSMRALNSRDRETLPPPPPPPEMVPYVQQNGYSPQTNGLVHDQSHYQHHMQYHHQNYDRSNMNSSMLPPMMIDELPPPPLTPDQSNAAMSVGHHRPPSTDDLPPSPPPPLLDETNSFQQAQNISAPPPPPPPPPMANGNGMATPSPGYITLTAGSKPKQENNAAKRHGPMAAAAWDGRSELLKAIRDGIELRKVDRKEPAKEEKAASAYHDVASILARRVAVEMSDSDSGSDSEYDSDGWGDEVSA